MKCVYIEINIECKYAILAGAIFTICQCYENNQIFVDINLIESIKEPIWALKMASTHHFKKTRKKQFSISIGF